MRDRLVIYEHVANFYKPLNQMKKQIKKHDEHHHHQYISHPLEDYNLKNKRKFTIQEILKDI